MSRRARASSLIVALLLAATLSSRTSLADPDCGQGRDARNPVESCERN